MPRQASHKQQASSSFLPPTVRVILIEPDQFLHTVSSLGQLNQSGEKSGKRDGAECPVPSIVAFSKILSSPSVRGTKTAVGRFLELANLASSNLPVHSSLMSNGRFHILFGLAKRKGWMSVFGRQKISALNRRWTGIQPFLFASPKSI